MEEVVGEVVKEMDYLREREQSLRDTNESTNDRVKWFALGTMATLVGLGGWQVVYLRAYFRCASFFQILNLKLTCQTDPSTLSRPQYSTTYRLYL